MVDCLHHVVEQQRQQQYFAKTTTAKKMICWKEIQPNRLSWWI